MQKIFDSFNKLSDQARYGILIVIVILVITLDALFLSLPQMAAIDNIKGQIEKLSQNTQDVLSDTQRMKPMRQHIQEQRDQLRALSDKIRSIQEVPLILSTISSIANEYGVKIDQLTPEKDLQKNLATDAYGKYYALPVVIKAHCGYHKFGHFLNKLESEDLFFIMQDFVIQNDASEANARSFTVTIEMILVDRAS